MVPVLAVAALALVLRLVHFAETQASPFANVLVGDGRQYDLLAQQIAGGSWLGTGVFYQAPLYPYFLAVLYKVCGHAIPTVQVVQAVIGTAACVCVWDAGRKFFDARTGLVAAILLALYPPAIHFDLLVQKTVLDVSLLALLLPVLARFLDEPRDRWAVVAGVVLGLLSLSRENALVLAPVIVLWIAIQFRAPSHRRWRWVLLFLVGSACVLAPVAVRNKVVGGELALTTSQLGSNFYLGNNPHTDGRYVPLKQGRGDARYEREDATDIAEQESGRSLTPSEVSRFWLRQSFDFIRSQPGAWLRLMGRKIALFWNRTEIADTESIEAYRDFSHVLRVLRFVHFGVLVPLAVLGTVLTLGAWRRLWILHASSLAMAASVIAFFIFARYREPIVPILVLFAGAGLVGTFDAMNVVRGRRTGTASATANSRGWWLGLAAAVAAAIWVNQPYPPAREQRAVTYHAVADVLLEEGHPDRAIPLFQEAIRAKPDFAAFYRGLGVAEMKSDHTDDALSALENAARLDSTDAATWGMMGSLYYEKGRMEQAARSFARAARLDPGRATTLSNLGGTLIALGRLEDALDPLRRSIRLEPGNASAQVNLGSALVALDRPREAVEPLRAATRLNPRNVDAFVLLGRALAGSGDAAAARAAFAEAARLAPGRADIRRQLDLLDHPPSSPATGGTTDPSTGRH
ncbi:MAG: tetratricopeptide repeat protein [Candidatus Eisenbacteria bacterium]|uniref:Tetratricopeptide repeat protein n=1 Tax=Eiseniibacteriota bacterium TaxID=2212470 RepID=A0A956RN58_UNCEI|nr:tetratricopeptide repeat protein [Candidatus Eisenbacteria bacterium]